MDAIALLKRDPETVEKLFARFEKKPSKEIANRFVRELAVHSAVEEQLCYPAVRKAAEAQELEEADDKLLEVRRDHLDELGKLMQKAKKMAPTHPHPRAPDEPPGNVLAGGLVAILDRGRDAMKGLVSRGGRSRGGRQSRQPDMLA